MAGAWGQALRMDQCPSPGLRRFDFLFRSLDTLYFQSRLCFHPGISLFSSDKLKVFTVWRPPYLQSNRYNVHSEANLQPEKVK